MPRQSDNPPDASSIEFAIGQIAELVARGLERSRAERNTGHRDAHWPLLLTAGQAASLCGASERTWRTWDSGGLVPRAIGIGRAKFWRTAELRAWVGKGCPRREVWDAEIDGEIFA